VTDQILIIFAATNGYLDELPVPDCRRYEKEMLGWMRTSQSDLVKAIAEKKDIKGELTEKMNAAFAEFGKLFQPTAKA
jgi:F-type H+/Na+-transporting ATPase subunit alpha